MKTARIPISIMAAFWVGSLHAQELRWHPMQSMHASYPNALAVTPNGTIYTASDQEYGYQGAFFSSTDRGASWGFVSTFRPNYWINSILAVNDSVLLANFEGNNEYFGGGLDTTGVYRSQDSGKTWKIVSNRGGKLLGIGNGSIVIQTDSLRRSTDLGRTWIAFSSPASVVIVPVASGVLAYNNDSLLHYTTDFKTWRVIFTTKPKNYYRLVAELRDGTLAIFSDSLYLSSNNGATWSSHAVNYHSQGNNYGPICFLRNGTLIGNFSGELLCHSSDSGQNWIPIRDGPETDGSSFGIDSSNDAFFGYEGYELIRVSDTSTTTVDCGPSNIPISRLATMPSGSLIAGAGPGFAEITSDDGAFWGNLLPLQAKTYWFGYQPRAGLVVEGYYGYGTDTGFLHSPDAISWGEISPVPYQPGSALSGFDTKGDVFLSDGSVTTDLGTTWMQHQSPPGPIVIGLPDGSAVSGALSRSTDLGATWQQTSAFPTGIIRTMASDSSGNIMLGTDQEVLLTTDVGKSWVSIMKGLPADTAVRQICYSTEGFWLAATSNGVYTLKEGDTTWQWNSTGLDDPNILCIDVGGPGKYYAGTSLAGIYTTEAPQSSVSLSSGLLAGSTIEAFPNPFSQSTTISFTPEASGYADVSIVNLLGVEVAHLFSGDLAAGEHSFVWNCSGALPCAPTDGMYECLVRMNGRVQTLPVVLAR